jgi:hypothetical protein
LLSSRPYSRAIFLWAAWIAGFLSATCAQEAAFEIHVTGARPSEAEPLRQRVERGLRSVQDRLGAPALEGALSVHACQSPRQFDELCSKLGVQAPAWALAIAIPRANVIAIKDFATQPLSDNDPAVTIDHELAHILIGGVERRRGGAIPRWLNEGLACWAAGEAISVTESLELARMAKIQELPDWPELESNFPRAGPAARRAYTQSLSFVLWLERELARRGLTMRDFIVELCEPVSWETALFRVVPLADPDFEWRYELSQGSAPWLYFFLHFGLWQFAGLLSLIAFARYLKQRRLTLQRLTEEDEAEDRRIAEQDAAYEAALQRAAESGSLEAESPGSESPSPESATEGLE